MTDLSKDTSNCCGAKPIEETDICSQCKEHADFGDVKETYSRPPQNFGSMDSFLSMWEAIS